MTFMPRVQTTPPHGADDDRPVVIDQIRTGRDGDETGNGAIEARQQINAAENRSGGADRRHDACCRREIRIDENVAHGNRIDRASKSEL